MVYCTQKSPYLYDRVRFNQSLSLALARSVSISVMSGCEVICWDVPAWTHKPGWVTPNEVSGSSLPTSVSGRITFPPFICIRDRTHFTAQHNVAKDNAKKQHLFLFFCFRSRDDSSNPVPSTSSELVDNGSPTQEGKQTSQESASASEGPRSDRAAGKHVDCHGGSQGRGYRKCCYPWG